MSGAPSREPPKIGADRWTFILPGASPAKRELLGESVVVVVNSALRWCQENHADVWATDVIAREVRGFSPGLAVWGPPESEAPFLAAGIPFVVLAPNAVAGPHGIPRPACAFFRALALACEHLKAKKVRVFGVDNWRAKDTRWKRSAFARCAKTAGAHGIEVERVG